MDLHGNILLNPGAWVLGPRIKDFSLSYAFTPSQWSIQCYSSISCRLWKCRLWKSFPVSLLQERWSYIKESCIKKKALWTKKSIQNSRHHYRTCIQPGGICVICRHFQAVSNIADMRLTVDCYTHVLQPTHCLEETSNDFTYRKSGQGTRLLGT